ncbi:MAG: DNA topoisomerase (ATP-hydrolyzing) subunit A [Treponemataceae bacterium]
MSDTTNESIIKIPIEEEVKQAYIDYSMSVIVSRALPDVRDGLKPVHRRILYSMEEKGLRYSGPTRKCAKIVGDVLGSYHPHGDASVYDALVRLGQDFSQRYPVICPQGNFGTIAGDPPAAYRYTEAKMEKIAEAMVEDIKKETVDFIPNFDDSTVEPTVLPAKFPFLLANGSSGIAVGMATNMPPHNLREIAAAISAYIDNNDITIDELIKHIKGPDFPTGGIIYGTKGIKQAYKTGRGKVIIRSRFKIETDKRGKESIVFTEVPYQVNTTNLVMKIGELARDKQIEGIANVNDESSDRAGLRIVVELKKGAIPKIVLNQLFMKTQLQANFGVINIALVNGRPETLNLKQLIQYFVNHRFEVITRRTQYDLRKAEERAHILRGLIIALNNIDEVIEIIKKSKDIPEAKDTLMKRFNLSEIQSQAIVDMKLGRLTSLEINKIKEELEELELLIEYYKDLLANPGKIYALIKEETQELVDKFGDDRRTDIVPDEVEQLDIEDLIQKEEMVILISNLGFIKRIPSSAYKIQNRGGKGSLTAKLVEDDFIDQVFTAVTHDYIMFISNLGKAYYLKVHEIPEATRTTKGTHIKALLAIDAEEEITAIVSFKEFSSDMYLIMATSSGTIKKITIDNFANAKTRGIRALNLKDSDHLVSAILSNGSDNIMMVTKQGKALRIAGESVRPQGRAAGGVRGINISDSDELAGAVRVDDEQSILLITANGYGKRVAFSEFSEHGRGTGGQKIYTVTERTGEVIGVITVYDDDEVVCITGQGKTLRLKVNTVGIMGRSAQGVRVLNIDVPDFLVGLDVVAREDAE